MEKTKSLIPLLIFLAAFSLRLFSFYPNRMIFGYDQVEDVLNTKKIVAYHDLITIGRISSGSGAHHGALFFYYLVPPFILSGGDPAVMAVWNSIFNSLSVVILYFLSLSLFKSVRMGLIVAFLGLVSYQSVQYSGWLSNPTLSIFLVPVFFLSLWQYFRGKQWWLILALASLGLSVQSQLLMLYLFLIVPIFWLIFKPKVPSFRILVLSALALIIGLLTMIVAEIKLNFSGVKTLLNFSANYDEARVPLVIRTKDFFLNFSKTISLNLWPAGEKYFWIVLLLVVGWFGFYFFRSRGRKERFGLYFLLLYFLSPFLMLPFGYHDKPWTFIGLTPAVALFVGFCASRIKSNTIVVLFLSFVALVNLKAIIMARNNLDFYIRQESPSILINQLAVIDYTYRDSKGAPFSINSVTYPLYYNTYWSYHYPWYGLKKYGYLPAWVGGDQLYPYNSLPRPKGVEKLTYMIIDNSSAIPWVHRLAGRQWAEENGRLVAETEIGGYTVIKIEK